MSLGVRMNKKILSIAAIGILIDQLVKILLVIVVKDEIVIIKDFFYFHYVKNAGGAWGIFGNHTYVLAIMSIIILLGIVYYICKEKVLTKWLIVSYGLLLAGIIGNLIDRLLFGYVRDFFDFYIFSYDFPVFNVADICIVVSVFMLIIETVRSEFNEHNSKC